MISHFATVTEFPCKVHSEETVWIPMRDGAMLARMWTVSSLREFI